MISALILKQLKADAERRVGPIRRVVITVPAYFDHTRREATCEAAKLAHLEVADLLNEPTAAALAYGFQEGFLNAAGTLADRKTVRKGVMTVVVYDLGGGTFDVTVMQIRDRQFKTLVTDGDVRLGGRDWDRRIIDHAAARYMAEHPGDDPRDDPVTLQSLLKEADEAKRTLSERSKTRLVYAHRGQHVTLGLSRAEFEELTADLLERTRATTKLALNEAGLEWSDVDKLLLSGGSEEKESGTKSLNFEMALGTESRLQAEATHGPFAPRSVPGWVAAFEAAVSVCVCQWPVGNGECRAVRLSRPRADLKRSHSWGIHGVETPGFTVPPQSR